MIQLPFSHCRLSDLEALESDACQIQIMPFALPIVFNDEPLFWKLNLCVWIQTWIQYGKYIWYGTPFLAISANTSSSIYILNRNEHTFDAGEELLNTEFSLRA